MKFWASPGVVSGPPNIASGWPETPWAKPWKDGAASAAVAEGEVLLGKGAVIACLVWACGRRQRRAGLYMHGTSLSTQRGQLGCSPVHLTFDLAQLSQLALSFLGRDGSGGILKRVWIHMQSVV